MECVQTFRTDLMDIDVQKNGFAEEKPRMLSNGTEMARTKNLTAGQALSIIMITAEFMENLGRF